MKPAIIIGSILLVIGILNWYLISSLRDKKEIKTVTMLQKAAKQAVNPWEKEQRDLDELSRLVKNIEDQTDS